MVDRPTMETLELFSFMFGMAEVVGALLCVCIAIWCTSYRGGFAWTSNPKIEFNWHPLLTTLGMVVLYGNGILVYRAFRNTRKRKLKIAHALIFILAFFLTVTGLQAAFDSHNLAKPPIPNMYSLHSWVGLAAVIIFACQWVGGSISFLYPTLSPPLRAAYYPVHLFFGVAAFVTAICATLMGLTEKAIYALPNYSELPSEGVLLNLIGLGVIIFGCTVIYLVTNFDYKRQPLPEDEMLLSTTECAHEIGPTQARWEGSDEHCPAHSKLFN